MYHPKYKKLFYKASHRGQKELDILLSSFLDHFFMHLSSTQDTELNTLEAFLNEEDPSLLDYFFGRNDLPLYVSEFFKCVFLSYQKHFILEKPS